MKRKAIQDPKTEEELMSDYGIARNENDTLDIEEEVTLLGLKYNLITRYTSFVAVDSHSISKPNDNETNPEYEDGNYGYSVDIENTAFGNPQVQQTSYIKLIGGNLILSNKLEFILSGINYQKHNMLNLAIINIKGTILLEKSISYEQTQEPITWELNEISEGIYFISLFNENTIIDTEKFILISN